MRICWKRGHGMTTFAHSLERFALAVEATVEAIPEHPLQFPVVYRSRRRVGVRRFPYGIFFEVQEQRIVVIACFHGRREPRRWQSR
jgi:plasmid stabilization system protein ParE